MNSAVAMASHANGHGAGDTIMASVNPSNVTAEGFALMCVCELLVCCRVKSLVTEPVVMESTDPQLLLKRAERQIKELKAELAMRDMLR